MSGAQALFAWRSSAWATWGGITRESCAACPASNWPASSI